MTLLELAERCEKATGHDLDLDHDIGRTLGSNGNYSYCPYTASLDAAMMLVPEGLAMGFKVAPCQRAHAMLATIGEEWSGSGSTPALALCATALRTRSTQEGDK